MKKGTIYKIENLVNGKVYIGQTRKRFKRRKGSHVAKLKGNYHINDHLQNSWNKYGKENFKFSIIERCLTRNLDDREIYWIDYYKEKTELYNFEGGGHKRKIITKETREKLSKAGKKAYKDPEILARRKKQWEEISGKGHFNNKKIICVNDQKIFYSITAASEYYGIKMRNISDVVRGRHPRCYSKDKKRKLQFEYYEEGKEYKLKSITHPLAKKVRCTTTGEIFKSITAAGKKYGIPTTNISKTCKGKQHHAGRLENGTQLAWEYA